MKVVKGSHKGLDNDKMVVLWWKGTCTCASVVWLFSGLGVVSVTVLALV